MCCAFYNTTDFKEVIKQAAEQAHEKPLCPLQRDTKTLAKHGAPINQPTSANLKLLMSNS